MINTMFEFDDARRVYAVRVNNTPIGELYMECDGFYVFEATEPKRGYWPAWLLKNIADKLEELNKEWEEVVKASFEALDAEALDTAEVLK